MVEYSVTGADYCITAKRACKYKSAQLELLASIFNSSVITHDQCTVFLMSHEPNTQVIFKIS